jgi:hypothetical protein
MSDEVQMKKQSDELNLYVTRAMDSNPNTVNGKELRDANVKLAAEVLNHLDNKEIQKLAAYENGRSDTAKQEYEQQLQGKWYTPIELALNGPIERKGTKLLQNWEALPNCTLVTSVDGSKVAAVEFESCTQGRLVVPLNDAHVRQSS